jgi:hypothetical protein
MTTVIVGLMVLIWLIVDATGRRLPWSLMLGCAFLAVGWTLHQQMPWWWSVVGAVLGLCGALVSGFPGGDRHAFIVLGMMLGPHRILAVMILTFLLLEGTLVVLEARHRSLVEWPLMPWIAAAVGCVIAVAPP